MNILFYENPVWEPAFHEISPRLAKLYERSPGIVRYFLAGRILHKLSLIEEKDMNGDKACAVKMNRVTAVVERTCKERLESANKKSRETVSVADFDENRWNECAPGIHFFITREEAVRYEL